MNDSTKIDLLGDVFELFSLGNEEEIDQKIKACREGAYVLLAPSLTADFKLRMYTKNEEKSREYYAAALIAAAFLIKKRGLPLSDILFETPCGNIEVFYTGRGALKIEVDKCKHLLSSQTVCAGCVAKYNDFFITKRIRAVHTDDISLFSKSNLPEFAICDLEFPVSVILSSNEEREVKMHPYSDFCGEFTSNLLLWCCAAFNERMLYHSSASKFQVSEYGAILEVTPSSVTVEIEPIIL